MFLIEGPDGFNNCCLAAIQMLEQLPLAKLDAQLSADQERTITIRIACDAGTVTYDPEAHNLPEEFVDGFKKHEKVVSAEDKVTITDRIFRRLKNPVKSRFVKWKHSNELGVDIYATADAPETLGLAFADSSPEQVNPAAEAQPTRDGLMPVPGRPWLAVVSDPLKSRKVLGVGAVILLSLVMFGLVRLLARPTSPPPEPRPQSPSWSERVQSPEWQGWRSRFHERLSAEKLTEKTLADALRIELPAHAGNAQAALRRDQAIADVLMTYPDVKKILWNRFGIDEEGFLGTGLSKPSSSSHYGTASVHEYLIENYFDRHPFVWMRILDPISNAQEMAMPIHELLESDPGPDDRKKRLLKEQIAQRVKEKNMAIPAVIRFGMLNSSVYSNKLGPTKRRRVFASNLAELWNTSVRDAAELSGHTFSKGDSVYIWVFLPIYPTEVVPATWGELLIHMPAWLGEIDTD